MTRIKPGIEKAIIAPPIADRHGVISTGDSLTQRNRLDGAR
jgi:hypothetical protein